MNKEELKETLRDGFKGWEIGGGVELEMINVPKKCLFDYIDQLDEPEKPVVPAFVAEWYENNKYGITDAFVYRYTKYPKTPVDERDAIDNWFANTDDVMGTLVKMKDGYTVEEKKYVVKFGQSVLGTPSYGSIGGMDGKKIMQVVYASELAIIKPNRYTEAEIKECGEEYMAFAVEVKP